MLNKDYYSIKGLDDFYGGVTYLPRRVHGYKIFSNLETSGNTNWYLDSYLAIL